MIMKKLLSILTILLFAFAITISSCGDAEATAEQCDSATETESLAVDGKCCGDKKGCCSGEEPHNREGKESHSHVGGESHSHVGGECCGDETGCCAGRE